MSLLAALPHVAAAEREHSLPAPSYLAAKRESAAYREAKAAARGAEDADEAGPNRWAVEHFLARAGGAEQPAPQLMPSTAPFAGWLITPREYERFDADGRPLPSNA